MKDNFYPTVDVEFIIEKILASGKVNPESQIKVGSSISFMLIGNKAFHKRLINLREIDGTVNYMQATAFAAIFGFMGDLLIWCEKNRDWKEGGYVVRPAKNS